MRYRFPVVPAAAAAVAIALLSGGCSSNNASASAPPVEKHNLGVGAVPVADPARVAGHSQPAPPHSGGGLGCGLVAGGDDAAGAATGDERHCLSPDPGGPA